ncbi:transposase [Pantoea agglomerans]|jgi:transposase|uniref:transposase n=1 Tax=Enterobacter agglomerans TaxID=549 RepID=UPI001F5B4ED7|nr:transposase [Pantoea agglomerans]MDQ0431016.1 transposase [Pantoea agglomerans]
MIAALDAELLSIQQQIGDHIDNYPGLKQDMKYMTSVKGIGKQVGSNTLAVLRGNAFSSPKQAAAWLDLVPQKKRSGSSVNGRSRLTQTGPADLRAKLYLRAMTAIKHNSMLRIFYERLLKAVKAKMSALCAVMRKLVHICYAVLMKQQEFDPNYSS